MLQACGEVSSQGKLFYHPENVKSQIEPCPIFMKNVDFPDNQIILF